MTLRQLLASRDEDAASRYFERFVDRAGSQVRFVLDAPAETISLLRTLRELPRLRMRLTDGVQGSTIRGQLDRTWLRRHALAGATSVLALPHRAEDYTRGSSGSKYALRKRSRSAAELGVRIERVDGDDRRAALRLLADERERVNPRDAYRTEHPRNDDMPACRYWFVATMAGRPILLAVLPAEGEWAALRYFRTLEDSEEATLARYLMMRELVGALVADGVRHVVVGMGPHRLRNGIRQFQRMVGFRLVRLEVRDVAPVPRLLQRGRALLRAASPGRLRPGV